jgi:hypothetical protein
MHDEKRFTFASPERKRKRETVDGGDAKTGGRRTAGTLLVNVY